MLKGKIGFSFAWSPLLMGATLAFLPSCGGTGETGGGRCTPNETQTCACPGGKEGVQTCNKDGASFSLCDCGDGTGGAGGEGASSTGGSNTGGGNTVTGACGDGIPDSGECEPGSENYCPEDCTGTGGGGGTGGDPCEGQVTFAQPIAGVPSMWGTHPQSNGKTGYEAGIEICKTVGADHPCDYEELLVAEAAGELAGVAQGTSFWVHRTTDAMVNGQVSPPGAGGRCNNWEYATNHISDGEYATFDTVGIPTYHLDNDTFYDGVNTTHTITGDLQCGGTMRALPCCFPICTP